MKNIKPRLKYLAVLSVASIAVSAQAGVIPGDQDQATAFLTIDGERLNLVVEPTDTGFQIPAGTKVGTDAGEVTFTQGVQLNQDPSIAYGFAVVDLGAPSAFGFSFATPIVPTVSPTLVASTLAAGLTDFTDNGIALTPTGAKVQTSGVSATGIVGPYVNMGVDIGPAFAAAGGGTGLPVAYVYGPFAEGPTAGPAGGPWDALKVDISFNLSGAGDVAALTGSASINHTDKVPEGGAGIAGLAAIGALLVIGSRKRA